MKDRIKSLLINGLVPSEIATVVGCSPSYVSQLCRDEEFKKDVETGKLAIQNEKTEEDHIDTRYQNLEHKLITAAEGAMAEASLGEIGRFLDTINKRKDSIHARKHPVGNQPAIQVNVVQLALPDHTVQAVNHKVTLNEKNEIIEIGGRALAPMSADAVKNLFAARQTVINDAKVIAEI